MRTSLKNSFFKSGVAVIWYSLLFGLAGRLRHPHSAVTGKNLWRGIELYYHAMGGALDRTLGTNNNDLASNTLQLSTHGGIDLQAWAEPGKLHLPKRINRFPTRESNRELYYWLAAFLANNEPYRGTDSLTPGVHHLLQGVATVSKLLNLFPSLKIRYDRLCQLELDQRRTAIPDPDPNSDNPAMVLECAIRFELGSGIPCGHVSLNCMIDQVRRGEQLTVSPQWRDITVPFLPVPLWAYRPATTSSLRIFWFRGTKKPKESVPEQSIQQAKFDAAFEPDPQDGIPAIQDHYTYPEWNYSTNSYRRNWCRVTEQQPKGGYRAELDPKFAELTQRVKKRFELIQQEPYWNRFLEEGEELDIDAFVTTVSDRRGYGVQSARYYRERKQKFRDLSVVILMDASRSTGAWIDKTRVIDVAKQSFAVLGQVLEIASDDFAMYSFSSDSRLRVRCYRIKKFDDPFDDSVKRNLLEVKPQNYTRMGPAIRHMGSKLHKRSTKQKLLIILSDGKPHDPTDRYEGRYALEDTRKALFELRVKKIECFGLTIDRKGERYLNYLFGPGHYAVYSHLHTLPDVLPNLYARLTDLSL